jgi:ligand-binding sensor domain-containing protein
MKASRGVVRGSFLTLALGLGGPSAHALDPSRAVTQYHHDAWNTREGLPQSSVESMAQTPDGYVWLGTQEGLTRFDGIHFTVFDKSNTKALRHNRVIALLADHEGSLWVGTEGGGLARVRDREWSLLDGVGLANPRVRALAEDAKGRVWVGTDKGLARWEAGRFVSDPGWDPQLRGSIHSLFAGKDRVFAGVEEGLLSLDLEGAKAQEFRGLPKGPVRCVWQDVDGTLWAGTSEGLFVAKPGETTLGPAKESLPGRVVTVIRRDHNGNLWVGIESAGLVRVSGPSVATLDTSRGLSNDQVLSLLEDREGNLWVGTQDGGVNRLSDARFKTYSAAEGLAGDIAWPVFGDREGSIWIGTKSGGLSRFRDGRFTTYSTAQGLSSNAVQSIAQDADGSLWIGTRNGGLDNLRDGRFTVYSTKQGLPYDSVSALLASREGGVWIGTRGGGLGRYKDGAFTAWSTRDGPTQREHPLPSRGTRRRAVDGHERRRPCPLPRGSLPGVHGSGRPLVGDRQT